MRDETVYLRHIRDAIVDIETYTSAGRAKFLEERIQQDAVVRKLEVIGEAVKNLFDAIKGARPDVPWRRIAGMRDKMIHEYFGLMGKIGSR